MNYKPTKTNSIKLLAFRRIALTCLLLTPATILAQPQTVEQKASYAIGINFAKSVEMQGIRLDTDNLIQGIKDGLSGNKTALTYSEMEQALETYKNQLIAEKQEAQKSNKQLGDAFLAANTSKDGVVTLKSGLQYKVIKSGNGPSPKLTDRVTTHYRGTLIDGTEFDSSYSRNKPTSFPVNGVIPGWTEALQLMNKGDKWQLFIPSELAYGERSVGNVIQPNSALIFEIELLEIN